MVQPYIVDGLRYLRVTQEGQQWVANLCANVFLTEHWGANSLVRSIGTRPQQGNVANVERELIKIRTAEGRKRAQERGVKFGRRPKLNAHQRREALVRREAGEALAEIGRTFAVSHSTISRLIAHGPASGAT